MVGFEDCGDYGKGAGVLMPLSGISRRERVTQEIDVPGEIEKHPPIPGDLVSFGWLRKNQPNRIIHQFQESW